MASLITARDGVALYPKVLRYLLAIGRPNAAPRNLPVRDAGLVVLELDTPLRGLPLVPGRQLNLRIAALEALQLLAGAAEEAAIPWAARAMGRMVLDERGHQHGNYGRRIGGQARAVVQRLQEDPQSRRAHVTLWDPALDNQPNKLDYPCTSSLTFSAGPDGDLDLTVFMRSNDAWLGLPYDLFQFTQLQCTVARALGWRPGRYRHVANSLHLYERDVEAAESLLQANLVHAPGSEPYQPSGVGRPLPDSDRATPVEAWDLARTRALAILRVPPAAYNDGHPWPEPFSTDLTVSERWYIEVMESYHQPATPAVAATAPAEASA